MKKFLIILSVVVFFFIGTYTANSMCVYNSTNCELLGPIEFHCGFFCFNIWNMTNTPPDNKRCRYAKAGTIIVCRPGPDCNTFVNACTAKVAGGAHSSERALSGVGFPGANRYHRRRVDLYGDYTLVHGQLNLWLQQLLKNELCNLCY